MGVRTWTLCISLAACTAAGAAGRTWRVGDGGQPWNLVPVSGRLEWGRGWACEILADDDGDGLVDEDPVDLVDNDDDALVNEDPADPQVDNDGDGQLNEDPVNNRDDDGDGLVDEDPVEAFDSDFDGLVDEDGPDPQIDNDGDGRLNCDPAYTNGDDDYDGRKNEDPPNGLDDDGDGLIEEDGLRRGDGGAVSATTWLRPVRLDSLRNLALQLNERYLEGEFGGVIPGQDARNSYMVIPSEYGFRSEGSDPVSADYFRIYSGTGYVSRSAYTVMADGNLFTAFGSSEGGLGGVAFNLMGYYHINRLVFRPRPTLPSNTLSAYYIVYGDHTSISATQDALNAPKTLVAPLYGQVNPAVKDLRFDPPVEMGRVDIVALVPVGSRRETAEAEVYGVGYPVDASYVSEVIDVGTSTPRVRRYDRQYELFAQAERRQADAFFADVPGNVVNWGRARWRGRRIGTGGDVRIQFRAGDSRDTHIYARRLGPGLFETRDSDGNPLDAFNWLKLTEGRVEQVDLQYNEIGADIGTDGRQGWSYWSAPFNFEDGLIDESKPPEQWRNQGIALPLPGGTRYLQFRIMFDSTVDGACMFDYFEFDYDAPLVSAGVVAEIFPVEVDLGQATQFHYYLKPQFAAGESGRFNRIEIDVPTPGTRIDSLLFDFRSWREIAVPPGGPADDPLAAADPRRVAVAPGSTDSTGQFAQAVVTDPVSGAPRLLLKVPSLTARDFRFGETLDIAINTRLYRGSKQFTSTVWSEAAGTRLTVIPQPTMPGDATPEVATNGVTVVARDLGRVVQAAHVQPNPFTPNGDGRNDVATFTFDVYLILDPTTALLDVFDLSGRQVQRLAAARLSAGRLAIDWDGRDRDGRLQPPGTYVYRLKVDADGRQALQTGTVTLAY